MEKKKKKSFTSIRVDPELWKEVKIEAIRRDLEVSEFVERALRKELKIER
jgi:predicted HicB family RNase H-like nuclease